MIIILHQADAYFLDSSEADKKSTDRFTSLEDLVLFGMSHELKVADEEVILCEPVLCTNGPSPTTMQGGISAVNGKVQTILYNSVL